MKQFSLYLSLLYYMMILLLSLGLPSFFFSLSPLSSPTLILLLLSISLDKISIHPCSWGILEVFWGTEVNNQFLQDRGLRECSRFLKDEWLMQGLEDTFQAKGTYKEQVWNKLASSENYTELSVWLSAPKSASLLPLATKASLGNDLTSLESPKHFSLTQKYPYHSIPRVPFSCLHPTISPMRAKVNHTAHSTWYLAYRIYSFSDYLLIYQHKNDKGV